MVDRRDVQNTYAQIGRHFAKTRPEPWEEVTEFLDNRTGTLGADIGAGNGRHAEVLARHVDSVLAIDASQAILETAIERADDRDFAMFPVLGDAMDLPMCSNRVDLGIYVATIHHLPTRTARIESLDELARILTDEGTAIVSAWAVTHERFERSTGFDTEIDWTLPDSTIVPRFYHIYDRTEFEFELAESDLSIEDLFESRGNFYAIVTAKG